MDTSSTFLGAGIVASFLAGMLAFLAPCCISFLFPSYFATAFKTKSRIFFMTFVYFVGLAIVLIPIGLGVSTLARIFSSYHEEVFLFGGLFMIFLAILTLFGKTIPMPFKVKADFQKSDVLSIFILGLLSGAASSCCTPVLVGVLTITALSGTFFYALLLSLTYVLGMVFPLFLLSYFWDKYDFSNAKWLRGKLYSWKIFTKSYYIHTSHLLSAGILFIMGVLIVVLAISHNTWTSVSYLQMMTNTFGKFNTFLIAKSQLIPNFLWIIIFIILIIIIIYQAYKSLLNNQKGIK